MSDKHYTKVRNILHTFSRSILASGQEFLDQATIRAGHHVNQHEVRADILPKIASIDDRNTRFTTINENGIRVVGGEFGSKYNKVIKFLDKVDLQEIPGTNHESYRVIDDKGIPLQNFIDPSDIPFSDTKLSDGYEIKVFASDRTTEIQRNYGWDFDTFNGILHFDGRFKPGCKEWDDLKWGNPVIEGFIYIGRYTKNEIDDANQEIKETQEALQEAIDNSLAIQPYKFTTDQMIKEGEPYPKELTDRVISSPYSGELEYANKPEMYQRVYFKIPGYCFEITELDEDQTFITEMRHTKEGDTQIFMDLLWDVESSKPILYYEFDSGKINVGNKKPVVGKIKFLAMAFVRNNGKKINVKDLIDFDLPDFEHIMSGPYSYVDDYKTDCKVPAPDTVLSDYPDIKENINVNIDLNNN